MSIPLRVLAASVGSPFHDDDGHWVDFRPITALSFVGPGRTKQSFKDAADINNIMAKFVRTATTDYVSRHEPHYGDFSPVDFQSSMNVVARANEMFADLPARIRKRFANDPTEFLRFIQDRENIPEMRKLGLVLPDRVDLSAAELEAERIRSVEARRAALSRPVPPPGGAPSPTA